MKYQLLPVVLGIVLSGLLVSVTDAEGAIYLKIEGIDGESTDDKHKNWVDVLSISEKESSKLISGEEELPREIILLKEIDKSSPKLTETLLQGKILPKIWLDFCPVEKSSCFDTFELINVIITSYSISGSSEEIPSEEFSLSFETTRRASPPDPQTPKDSTVSEQKEKPLDTSMAPKTKVPGWVQTTAQFWIDKNVSDREFTDALGFLVKEKIIDVQVEEQTTEHEGTGEPKVPAWISETTKWWIEGQVPEDQFLEGIKWMIKNKIIQGL